MYKFIVYFVLLRLKSKVKNLSRKIMSQCRRYRGKITCVDIQQIFGVKTTGVACGRGELKGRSEYCVYRRNENGACVIISMIIWYDWY